jgi:hypothetical protein
MMNFRSFVFGWAPGETTMRQQRVSETEPYQAFREPGEPGEPQHCGERAVQRLVHGGIR